MKTRIFNTYSLLLVGIIAAVLTCSCEKEDDTIIKMESELPDSLSSTYYKTEADVNKGLENLYKLYHASEGKNILYKDKLTAFMGADDLTTTIGGNKQNYRDGDLFINSGNNSFMDILKNAN